MDACAPWSAVVSRGASAVPFGRLAMPNSRLKQFHNFCYKIRPDFFFQEFSEKSRFRNFQKIPISSVSNFPKF
jgi:hypothetical protein